MEQDNEPTVEVYEPRTELEGNIVRDILRDSGIEAGFNSNWCSWYDGLFVTTRGPGSIFVLEKDAQEAKKIIREYLDSLKNVEPSEE